MKKTICSIVSFLAVFPSLVCAQLSGSVGPLTSVASKEAHKTCNVLDYGGKADGQTDIGPAITAAFNACNSGGLVVIPSGNYALATWVTLNGGSWALQLDGIINRTGSSGGTMITVENSNDFELFSSTGKGAIQGNGYVYHAQGSISGPRILRIVSVNNFSIHDLALTDSPSFHLSLATCTNGEVYNMAIRGANEGGLDGIDLWGTNLWVHDVMVTNRDECVTVKSPSNNIQIEQIYCNMSGGCALGSLGADTSLSNILYRNVYTWSSNEMMLIKSYGGSGTVSQATFENFIGHSNAYSIWIDSSWSGMKPVPGNGVQLNDITFRNWKGTEANGVQRGPIQVFCANEVPCTGITIEDFAMWTDSGNSQVYKCENAYGSGFCLRSGSGGAYSEVTTTVTSPPAGYSAPTMPWDLSSSFGTTQPIPIPSIPSYFYPGTSPLKPLAHGSGGGLTTSSPSEPTSTTSATTVPSGCTASHYAQCGGSGWTGCTVCASPYTCQVSNAWYSQCL